MSKTMSQTKLSKLHSDAAKEFEQSTKQRIRKLLKNVHPDIKKDTQFQIENACKWAGIYSNLADMCLVEDGVKTETYKKYIKHMRSAYNKAKEMLYTCGRVYGNMGKEVV